MAREQNLARRERPEIEQMDPWNTFRDMERMFRDFFLTPLPMMRRGWMPEMRQIEPEVDLKETEHEFIMAASVPGMKKDDIDINVTEDRITISGERKSDEQKPEERFHVRQQSYGSFRVTYSLPSDVKPEEVNATYRDGILEVHLPKAEVVQPHKVEIKAEEEAQSGHHVQTE